MKVVVVPGKLDRSIACTRTHTPPSIPYVCIHTRRLIKPLHPEHLLEAIVGLLTWYVPCVSVCAYIDSTRPTIWLLD